MPTLTVPSEYGYVILSATGTWVLSIWLSLRTGSYRRIARVPTPQQYVIPKTRPTRTDPGMTAEEHAFNCAQRGHQNYLEWWPGMLVGILLGGLEYPLTCAVSGALWIVFRAFFAIAYNRPDWGPFGMGRYRASMHYAPPLVVWGVVAKMGVDMVKSG